MDFARKRIYFLKKAFYLTFFHLCDIIMVEKIKGIENFDVSNVKNMSRMFEGCIKLNVDLSAWKPNYNKLERVTDMFNGTKIEYPRWYAEYILLR